MAVIQKPQRKQKSTYAKVNIIIYNNHKDYL